MDNWHATIGKLVRGYMCLDEIHRRRSEVIVTGEGRRRKQIIERQGLTFAQKLNRGLTYWPPLKPRPIATPFPMDEVSEPKAILAEMDETETRAIIERVDGLMRKQERFRDANLNLNRLARRAGLTARRISIAVNRVHTRNVSQYINSYRIAEACRQLATTVGDIAII